ncbi:hypothetical protein PEX1_004870 [Penicillium expansum]|uniref:Uncharacterized protein n=1 Tax=Penicillium expansum TaxID=27334 RepID=A0A0A2IGQ1_PENEN|nr:hypothetical protein PEX2_032690 [Penicillium expansum]KGO41633.1 hypothetical protein PEXP_088570 [Penicillium expansum]KGO60130.1 hypothetical protein PEX2_032690 [Penicillium expansum]KGO61404.1 hypothetical protein PEX1_004870 [Penicillium expansum]
MPPFSHPKHRETKRVVSRGVRAKEDSLYLKWSVVMNPSELLKELVGNREHARALFHGLRRQVKSIRHRSQSYDDGQVTIYDRVLLRLYDEGHTMQHYGLLEFYLAEYLGTKNSHSEGENNSVIAAHFAAQHILDNGPISEIPIITADSVEGTTEDVQTSKSSEISGASKSQHVDKLIQVYQKAKADYYILEVTESHRERTNSVRFLRDTAENLLRYLMSADKDHDLIPEIEDIIQVSQTHANQLAGGRKRKFEHMDNDSRGSLSPNPYKPYGDQRGRRNRRDRYVPDSVTWDHSHKGGWDHSHVKRRIGWDSRALDSYRP